MKICCAGGFNIKSRRINQTEFELLFHGQLNTLKKEERIKQLNKTGLPQASITAHSTSLGAFIVRIYQDRSWLALAK